MLDKKPESSGVMRNGKGSTLDISGSAIPTVGNRAHTIYLDFYSHEVHCML